MKKIFNLILTLSLIGSTLFAENVSTAMALVKTNSIENYVEKESAINNYINIYMQETADLAPTKNELNYFYSLDSSFWDGYSSSAIDFQYDSITRKIVLSNVMSPSESEEEKKLYIANLMRDELSSVNPITLEVTTPLTSTTIGFIEQINFLTSQPDTYIGITEPGDTTQVWYKPNGEGGFDTYKYDPVNGIWVLVEEGDGGPEAITVSKNLMFAVDDNFNKDSTPGMEGQLANVENIDGTVYEYIYTGNYWVLLSKSSAETGQFFGTATLEELLWDIYSSSSGSKATVDILSQHTEAFSIGYANEKIEFTKMYNSINVNNDYWISSKYVIAQTKGGVSTQVNGLTKGFIPRSPNSYYNVEYKNNVPSITNDWVVSVIDYEDLANISAFEINARGFTYVYVENHNKYFNFDLNKKMWTSTDNSVQISYGNTPRNNFTHVSGRYYLALNNDCTTSSCYGTPYKYENLNVFYYSPFSSKNIAGFTDLPCGQYESQGFSMGGVTGNMNKCERAITSSDCSNGMFWNNTTNKCQELPTCPAGTAYSNSNNMCVINATCDSGYSYNSITNKCEKSIICPSGSYWDTSNNRCIMNIKCTGDLYWDNANNRCIKDLSSCPNGSIYNSGTNKCEASATCDNSHTLNTNTDKCEKTAQNNTLQENPVCSKYINSTVGTITGTYNINTNICNYSYIGSCSYACCSTDCGNSAANAYFSTEYNHYGSGCNSGYYMSAQYLVVDGYKVSDGCSTIFTNNHSCLGCTDFKWINGIKTCKDGTYVKFNQTIHSSSCSKSTTGSASCSAGYSLNTTTDKCEKTEQVCTLPDILSGSVCQDNPICPSGLSYNTTTDKCEYALSCPAGTSWNNTLSRCETAVNCDSGYSYNSGTNKCEKTANYKCSVGTLSGSDCLIDPTCSSGSYNTSTNKCEYTYAASSSTGTTCSSSSPTPCSSPSWNTHPGADGSPMNMYRCCQHMTIYNCISPDAKSGAICTRSITPTCSKGVLIGDKCTASADRVCTAPDVLSGAACQRTPVCNYSTALDPTTDICYKTLTCPSGTTNVSGQCRASGSCSSASFSLSNTVDKCINSGSCDHGGYIDNVADICKDNAKCISGTFLNTGIDLCTALSSCNHGTLNLSKDVCEENYNCTSGTSFINSIDRCSKNIQ